MALTEIVSGLRIEKVLILARFRGSWILHVASDIWPHSFSRSISVNVMHRRTVAEAVGIVSYMIPDQGKGS